LSEDLGIDSMDRLALAIELEQEFEVAIFNEALCRVRTIGDVVPCVAGAMDKKRRAAKTG